MDFEEKKEEVTPAVQPAGIEAALPAQVEAISFPNAVLGVFLEPSKTFPFLATKKLWIIFPLVLIALSTFVSSFIFFERVDREAFMIEQLRKSKFAAEMPQDKFDEVVKNFKEKSSLMQSLTPPIFYVIWLLLAALVYYFCFLALGGVGGFMQTWIVVSWAELTTFLAQLVSIPIMLFKAPDQLMHPESLLLSNPAALIGVEKLSPAVFALLSTLDVFAAFNMALLIIGMAAVSKLSKGMSAMILISLYVLKAAIKVAWVAFMVQ
jgi:hypothetical protein